MLDVRVLCIGQLEDFDCDQLLILMLWAPRQGTTGSGPAIFVQS